MGKWEKWAIVSTGPFQGKPELTMMGIGKSGYVINVRDRAGNVIKHIPAAPGRTGAIVNTGGAGIIANLAMGPTRLGGFLATGSDKRLYHIESNGSQYRWQQTFGPGQFLGTVSSWATLDGYAEILGEGTDHQLAYAFVTPEQDRDNIEQWENFGRPGETDGKKGLNGRPAVVFDGRGLHVLARGQDNHLWHTFGKDSDHQGKRTFDSWTNLGGSLTQVPVAIRTQKGIECLVIGENREPFVNTWDGTRWSGFESMGGQLKGLPAAINVHGSDRTFVFGRGVHDKLWYCQRNGTSWQEWQSLGDGLTGDPAVWEESLSGNGKGLVSCVVLRENGELWLRELQLTRDEYSGRMDRGE
jgi:hypothetical protein